MKLDYYISNCNWDGTAMALGTSLLQCLLDQEIAEWATIVSLIDHHQTNIYKTEQMNLKNISAEF